MTRLICLLALLPVWGHAESIYLCKGYSGGTFWAQKHCNQHNALIDRIVSVPDGMPFDQQVNLGQQQRQATTNTTTVTNTVTTNSVTQSPGTECKALAAQVTNLDAMARQPQSGQTQDWITSEKRKVRDRQFQLRC